MSDLPKIDNDVDSQISLLHQLIARQQTALDELKSAYTRLAGLPLSPQPHQLVTATATRRKALGRLGMALLGGAGLLAATTAQPPQAQAKISLGQVGTGALIVPSTTEVSGSLAAGKEYGLLVSARPTLNLSNFTYNNNTGIYGEGLDHGVYGVSYGATDSNNKFRAGVYGLGYGVESRGVYGYVTSKDSYGTAGVGNGNQAVGAFGGGFGTEAIGVRAETIGDNSTGVYAKTSGSNSRAFYVEATGISPTGLEIKVSSGRGIDAYGSADKDTIVASNSVAGRAAIAGYTHAEGGKAVYGFANTLNCSAIVGSTIFAGSYAGDFLGWVRVSGTLSAAVKNFRIDHPLDPANSYLQHASIESDQMLNLYSGTVRLDAVGRAWVKLPAWLETLNHNFTYQLTPLAEASQPYIATRLKNGQFEIAGGLPDQEICWQLTGLRQDPWAKANPLEVEKLKPDHERGLYQNPEVYGQDRSKSIGYFENAHSRKAPADNQTKK